MKNTTEVPPTLKCAVGSSGFFLTKNEGDRYTRTERAAPTRRMTTILILRINSRPRAERNSWSQGGPLREPVRRSERTLKNDSSGFMYIAGAIIRGGIRKFHVKFSSSALIQFITVVEACTGLDSRQSH